MKKLKLFKRLTYLEPLIFQHQWTGIDNGLNVLQNYGTLSEVMNVYDTPLYYFERNRD
ncbi:MAG: hypothetical protein FWF51_08300 [Chitinivibrionia bacterium]|nr:hypothetical protein [Chitinivibrionia bacterium]